jgi:hypothetical protein
MATPPRMIASKTIVTQVNFKNLLSAVFGLPLGASSGFFTFFAMLHGATVRMQSML